MEISALQIASSVVVLLLVVNLVLFASGRINESIFWIAILAGFGALQIVKKMNKKKK